MVSYIVNGIVVSNVSGVVLILVVVDNGLVQKLQLTNEKRIEIVLILVVVDNGLVHAKRQRKIQNVVMS